MKEGCLIKRTTINKYTLVGAVSDRQRANTVRPYEAFCIFIRLYELDQAAPRFIYTYFFMTLYQLSAISATPSTLGWIPSAESPEKLVRS